MQAGELSARLGAIVGSAHVRAPREEELSDATRWAGLRGEAELVVEPATADEVAAVVAACYEAEVPITPRGGGTGLAGGAVPGGGVVLATDRLRKVRQLDPQWWRVEVEAGVTTAELQRRVAEVGLRYPPDPGAAESSTIGGNLATNAGGPHAFAHGVTGHWVLGLEAVLAPGELVRLGGAVRKDVAGYDLVSLLVGSEGTLGVITAAWLRLVPPPAAQCWVGALFDGHEALQRAIGATLISGIAPAALELLDAHTLAQARATLPWPAATAALGDGRHLLLASLEGAGGDLVAESGAQLCSDWEAAGAVWTAPEGGAGSAIQRWRDGIAVAVAAARGGKLSEDVTVPVDRIAELLDGVREIAEAHGLEHATWGHAGDGNLHASFLIDPADAGQRAGADRAAEQLFALAAQLGGTISGEHGLGRLKSGQLGLQWAPAALEAHRAIKRALDPKNLLNPGRKLA